MFQWLQQRPASRRIPARPAPADQVPSTPTPPAVAPAPEPFEDTPPPFFADTDAAFLDLGDVPGPSAPPREFPNPPDARIAAAIASVPPFPAANDPERAAKLRQILRALDEIASQVCDALEPPKKDRSPLPVSSIPR